MKNVKRTVGASALSTVLAALAVLATPEAMGSGNYQTRVIIQGLNRPSGIVAGPGGTLYITQLPTPGVPGSAGGLNSVDRISTGSGRITNLTLGEPEPTNLALDKSGNLYWTCKSAGVILRRTKQGAVGLFLDGLTAPSGIAVDRWDNVYFTQLPTPGVPGAVGGLNTVNVSDGTGIGVLTLGEPEPTDIAVSRDGDAYWTCKSAGVILRRSVGGVVSLVLHGLSSPTGIALDHSGQRLYFTEVPTPGMPGSIGGLNKVSVYDLSEGMLHLIHMGDPEPTDVSVARNGTLYWTCTSAGVIVEAAPVGHPR